MTTPRLTPPEKLPAFALIIRSMSGANPADQAACLNMLHERGLWLGPEQVRAAVAASWLDVEAYGQSWRIVRRDGQRPPFNRDRFDSEGEAYAAALEILGYHRRTAGQALYEAELRGRPAYYDGAPRPHWERLDEIARRSWERGAPVTA